MAIPIKSTTPVTEKDLAQTPDWFIKSLEAHLNHPIDMDVCALPETAKAEAYYSLVDDNDALVADWVTDWQECEEEDFIYPFCYCNPPFSDIHTWMDKVIEQVGVGADVAMLLPNNPETAYIRKAKRYAETIIEMPFRLKFLRPDGTKFLDKNGKEQGPLFSCMVAMFTKVGLSQPTHHTYHDFREGFYRVK